MTTPFRSTIRSEWLKQQHGPSTVVVVGGGTLVPCLTLLVLLKQRASLAPRYRGEVFWELLWNQMWESLSVLLVPLLVILLTGLVTQLEYRHNAWKQLFASPQHHGAIYIAKLLMVLLLIAELFMVVNGGIWLAGVVPPAVFAELSMPVEPFPIGAFAMRSLEFYCDLLPIAALQFAVGLHVRHPLITTGVGLGVWLIGVTVLPWQLNYVVPYNYLAIDYFVEVGSRVDRSLPMPLSALSLLVAAATLCVGYLVFRAHATRGA
jgi:lantibiotic transport system permease protein